MRHVHATENCEGEVRIISVKKMQLYLIVYMFITVANVAVNVTSVLHP